MTSDTLILLETPVNESDAQRVCDAIYKASTSAVVSFKPTSGDGVKAFLVKFDPDRDKPKAMLDEVRAGGWAAVLAGG